MRVYRKLPSGLRPGDLRAAARRRPGRALLAICAPVLGAVSVGLAAQTDAIASVALLAVGIALILSPLSFARFSAQGAVVEPALVLESVNAWTGQRRSTWSVRSDGSRSAVERVVGACQTAMGEPLVAVINSDGDEEESLIDLALAQSDRPFIAAWTNHGLTGTAAIRTGVEGVWLRVDPQPAGTLSAVMVADVGEWEGRMRSAVESA